MKKFESQIEEKLEFSVNEGYVRFRCRCGNYVDFKGIYIESLIQTFPIGIQCTECGRIIKWNINI
jgi:hypothetical protein